MNELIGDFLKFNKVLGLKIANHVSSNLSVGLCVSEFSGGVKEYYSSVSNVSKVSFIAQFSYFNRGIMFCIDPKIIEISTQRCFGGKETMSTHDLKEFSFSEQFVGNFIVSSLDKYFTNRDCGVELSKLDHHLDRSHLFFSDEQVVFVEMKCSIKGNAVGGMYLFYPLIFVKQESEKWMLDD